MAEECEFCFKKATGENVRVYVMQRNMQFGRPIQLDNGHRVFDVTEDGRQRSTWRDRTCKAHKKPDIVIA